MPPRAYSCSHHERVREKCHQANTDWTQKTNQFASFSKKVSKNWLLFNWTRRNDTGTRQKQILPCAVEPRTIFWAGGISNL